MEGGESEKETPKEDVAKVRTGTGPKAMDNALNQHSNRFC